MVPCVDGKLLVTRVTVSKADHVTQDNHFWANQDSFLTVSVDWENEGVAPEVAECEMTLIPTTTVPTPAPIPSASESTTSSGPKGQEYGPITLGTLALFAIAKLF
ncbi:hypothetical protein ACTXT7_017156 [Hymenolepis weldensis]